MSSTAAARLRLGGDVTEAPPIPTPGISPMVHPARMWDNEFAWTCGGDNDLAHVQHIDTGAIGEVHKVWAQCLSV